MKSLTYKLALIFLVMSLIPLVIGTTGALTLQTAGTALNANDKALKNLSALLNAAGESLTENARIQERASSVTGEIANAQDETYAALKEMGDLMLPRSFAIARMRFALIDASTAERGLLLTLNMRHLDEQELQETRDAQMQNIAEAMTNLNAAREQYLALVQGSGEKSTWESFESALAAWQANHKDFMEEIANLERLVDDMVRGGPLFASAARKAYDTAFIKGKSAREACEKSIEMLNDAIARSAEADMRVAMDAQTRSQTLVQNLNRESGVAADRAEDIRSQIETARMATAQAAEIATSALEATTTRFWYMVAFSALCVLGAMAFGLLQAWRVSRPVRNMATHMSRIAAGDLTENVPTDAVERSDEIGQLAKAMQGMILSNRDQINMANAMAHGDYTRPMQIRSQKDQLGQALGAMLINSNEMLSQVSKAVERVGDGAASVSEASRSLSQGAQTSAAALEEISQTANSVDRQAKDNALYAQEANQLATTSRDAAKRGYKAVTELVASMHEIQQAGKQIASVAKLIDDIAFQTNLLALNAAVEAARAGRQGKGFSVVADEVRNLSGRSAKAARETGTMVAAMTERMEVGAQLAARSDQEFHEIVDATDQVAKLFEDITAASNAQSSAMAQISQGLEQIDAVIQANMNNAGRTASSAQTLSNQAEELRGMVNGFKLLSDPARKELRSHGMTTSLVKPQQITSSEQDRRLLSAPQRQRERT